MIAEKKKKPMTQQSPVLKRPNYAFTFNYEFKP